LNTSNRSEIAIVGMSGHFPGARSIDALWQNLKDGVEARTTFSDDEIRAQGVSASLMNYPAFVKSGFVLDEVDAFDSAFFGFSPREADVLDPQHRLFLETAWEALEDAGYDTERFSGSVAVFGGATYSGYPHHNVFRNPKVVKSVGGRQAIYGSVPEYMVTRVAYKLNLRGPVYFVQTACSTSLVAVHLGCQSLINHESDMVLAGGVSVQLPHRLGYLYEEGGMLSPDGRVHAFDSRARGTVFSSGVGIVVLKRLEDAIADGDSIRAVIKGVATNNDGAFKVGFTAPSVTGQAQVVAEALANAHVSPDSIGYVETHGTGTELGDPIEISALTRAFRAGTDRKGFCPIGSIKPNVGHLDAAAGVSSLIKTVLAMEHGQIPPTINYENQNPKIDFDNSPFFVNTTLRLWPANNGTPRRAGVSSFGFGGTNAHVVVEEKPATEPGGPSRSRQLLLISAKTEEALDASAKRLGEFLGGHRQINLADVAHTLRVGRRLFANRRAVVCTTVADAVDALHGADDRRVLTGTASGSRPIVFMFPGQGAQYVNMGLGLYQEEPVFRDVVDSCAARLVPHLGFDLREVLYPADGVSEATSARLKQTAVTQAALFVVELALARLWMSWGVTPAAMIGHSIGEFVAAHLAGVIGLDDALRLVAARGRLMGELPGGVMLAVPLPEAEVRSFMTPDLWISAVNGPSLTVISGDRAAIDQVAERLRSQGVESRPLHTSHAFHSGMMDGAVGPLVEIARTIELSAPRIPYISNVTGTWITDEQARDPEYWGRHLRQAVRFSDGAAELLKDQTRMFLELGPGNVLSSLIRYQARTPGSATAVATLRQAQEQTSDGAVLLSAVGQLWICGAEFDWSAFSAGERRLRVPLPTYPFARTRHWVYPIIPDRAESQRLMAITEQMDLSDWFHMPTWKRSHRLASKESAPVKSLVFLDDTGLGARLAARQERLGSRVVTVSAGPSFNRLDDERFEINPGSPSDYSALVAALLESDKMPDIIVHLWGVTKESARSTDRTATYEERGFYSLLSLAQSLGETGSATPIRLLSVTDGLQQVSGVDPTIPEKAAVTGPCRVIPYEFPHISVRQLDLDIVARGDDDAQIDQILNELADDTGSQEAVVAYRKGVRWSCVFQPVRLPPIGEQLPARIRQEGVYLITGGLGGVGLVLAEQLARTARAKLVLTGRRGLPPRGTWDEHLAAHKPDDSTSVKIRAVRSLEALGAEVMIGSADVVDEDAMRAVVADARSRFGRIDGVVHAAGIAGGGMMLLKKREVAASVLAPKVTGTQVLERVLAGQPLDFLVLCSSLTGVLGGVGQVDYCGANAYLDAFAAHHAAATGTLTVAINWNAWREVGMAIDTDIPEDLRETMRSFMLATGISNKQGVDAFFRVLTYVREPQVALSPFEVDIVLAANFTRESGHGVAAEQTTSESSAKQAHAHPRPNLQTPYVAPASDAQKQICAIWEDMLGLERVGVHDNFFDLGGHSLLAIQVMGRVNQTMKTAIPVAKLYEGLTIAFLSSLLAPRAAVKAAEEDDEQGPIERRQDKARRQREQQQRRRVALGR
jgi:acyl transferase domain-containing protein